MKPGCRRCPVRGVVAYVPAGCFPTTGDVFRVVELVAVKSMQGSAGRRPLDLTRVIIFLFSATISHCFCPSSNC
jgi:hypothetical protein